MLAMGHYNGKKVAKLLLKNRADMNHEDRRGSTALRRAVYCNKREVVEMLIKFGCEVDYQNKYGCTALMLAVIRDNSKIAKLLVICTRNPCIRNNQGENAWNLAKDKPIILEILKEYS